MKDILSVQYSVTVNSGGKITMFYISIILRITTVRGINLQDTHPVCKYN